MTAAPDRRQGQPRPRRCSATCGASRDLTTGRLRWGILTNGTRWRLYYQGARSVSEEFYEIDLAAVLDIAGHNDGLFALDAADRYHWLKVFVLLFRREAFVPAAADRRTFHQRALDQGR